MSKYVRTTITNPDGTISPARINTETGEIKPYKHWKKVELEEERNKIIVQGTMNEDTTKPLFWEVIPPPDYSKTIKQTINKPRKNKQNDNNIYLKDYMTLTQAKEELPLLDNVLTGVSQLESYNSRPLNQSLLFSMLRDLDTINVNTVQQYTGYSLRYCQQLVTYLNILSHAFDAEIER